MNGKIILYLWFVIQLKTVFDNGYAMIGITLHRLLIIIIVIMIGSGFVFIIIIHMHNTQ